MRTLKTKLPDGRTVETRTDRGDVRYCRIFLIEADGAVNLYDGPWPNGIANEKHREAVTALKG